MIFNKTLNQAPESNNENAIDFIALTPVDDADEKSNYFRALMIAIGSDNICNIALTGPYGSGKSSIIKTFEKNNRFRFLNISLASFKEESESHIPNNLIERSILQQMLYGTDANKLPYSRFKRITIPDKSLIKSALFALWALAIGYIYLNNIEFLNLNIFNNIFVIQVLIFAFAIAFPIVLISDIHKASYGISFKKLSLKNAEIEATDTPENSILNRHLDEIIYFFQVVDYKVVVIEDLDRFGSPEIFVKLREINKLINDNRPSGKKIKFLYALKDDMFVHDNRVKFFDFIIPVIPIVNTSNSLEMMRNRLKDKSDANKISEHFLREIALYIDDMRIIHNIFNEFNLYKLELASDSLNTTKLLAMMIYKNVYPDDFEKLHHGKGALYKIGNIRTALITEHKQKISDEVASLKKDLAASEEERVENEIELIRMFIGHIVSSTTQPVNAFYIDQKILPFSEINNWELFSQLFNVQNIFVSHVQQGYNPRNFPLGKSFIQLQTEISPNLTFPKRKENIENKTATKRLDIQTRIRALEKEKTTISQLPLHQLIMKNNLSVEEILTSNGISNLQPLTYMIKYGHLDESHHLYTSKFYEGRLTRNDHDFLVTIRDFKKPDPKQQIDTPKEVCLSMRPEDFAHNYVLNVAIIDFLLMDNAQNRERLHSAIGFLSTNFATAEDFFTAYWDIGRNIGGFVKAIAKEWPGYGAAAVKSSQAPEHLALILQHVDSSHVVEKMNLNNVLTNYISNKGFLIYASDVTPPDKHVILKDLKVAFINLADLSSNKDLLDFAHRENLYEINPVNIGLLLGEYCVNSMETLPDHTTANYSTISAYGSPELKGHINANLSLYLDKVFLALPTNTKEAPNIIRQLLNSDQIRNDKKLAIISKQELRFETFTDIPAYLWGAILSNDKIDINWKNIVSYLRCEEASKDIVTSLLNSSSVIKTLSMKKIDSIKEEDKSLMTEFIFGNDSIFDTGYCELVHCLTFKYSDFPEALSHGKLQCLIKDKAVELSESTFKYTSDDELLLPMLLGYNVREYIANKNIYPISDDIRAELLTYEMSEKQKISICLDASPDGVLANRKLAKQIAELLALPNTDCSHFENSVIVYAIAGSQRPDTSIKILTKCISDWDRKIIIDVLEQLPEPYSDIAKYGRKPKIPDTLINRLFANLLVEKGIISSSPIKKDFIRINTFKSPN